MQLFKNAVENIKAARRNTSGLLFFFPLGLILFGSISSTYFFFLPGPKKGIFADGIEPTAFSIGALIILTLTTLVGTWAWVIRESQNGRIWPRWTSLLTGSITGFLIGSITGILAQFVFLFFVLLFIVAATAFEHYIVFAVFVLVLWLSIRYDSSHNQVSAQTEQNPE